MTAAKPVPCSTALAFIPPGAPDADVAIASLRAEIAEARRLVLVETAARAHGVAEDLIEFLTADTAQALDDQARRLGRINRWPETRRANRRTSGTTRQEEDHDHDPC